MKTKEELNELKEEVEALSKKLHELTEDELEQVTGGKEDMAEQSDSKAPKSVFPLGFSDAK